MIYLLFLVFEIFVLYVLMRRTLTRLMRLLGPRLFAVVFLPGTFIHEMSHFLTALVLLVPVGNINLTPKIEEDGVRLGSVPIAKTDPIRRTLIGIAPIFFGLAIILGSIFYVYTNNLFGQPIALVILALVAFEVGNTMFASKKDLEGVFAVFVVVVLIGIVLYLLGLRVSFDTDWEIIKKADLFLLVPIGIDVILNI